MTKISKKAAYPVKIPVRKDYFVGTDSENNGKTVNFDFESTAKLINGLNGTPILNYLFKTDLNIPLTVLTEGVFLSEGNQTTLSSITKLYINKKNFNEDNMSDLFRFISINREVFVMKLRNSSNLANGVYFKITGATEFENHFVLNVAIDISNVAFTQLINFNIYFFDFELKSLDLAITLPEFNKIVTQTGFTSTGSAITFNPSWTWLIKNVNYTNPLSVIKTIIPSAIGKKRIDVFVLNTLNTFQTISGAETTGSPVKPTIPLDTIEVTFCIVGDAGIETVQPLDLSAFASIVYVDFKLLNKVDKAIGYSLTKNDLTDLLKTAYDNTVTWVATNGANLINHLFRTDNPHNVSKSQVGLGNVDNTSDANKPVSTAQANALALKLNISDYSNRFKGVYLTQAALISAHPTASIGDYAQVNEVGATDVVNYNWDAEENIWVKNAVVGSAATNTDQLPEGTSNLYFTVTRFLANLTYANVISALGFTPSTAPNNAQKNSDITKAEIEAKLIGEITSHTHPSTGGGDMVLASTQTVSGLKTFLVGMFGLRNVANTFTSFFTNSNTASRTYTFQNRDGTIADLTDIAGVNTGKMNTPSGTVNFLSKFITASTIGLSRLFDDGTFFGIGTSNAPTKDFTLGNQSNREIGVEESQNTIIGRTLTVSAGRTINYLPNVNFNALNQPVRNYIGMTSAPNGNIYAVVNNGDIFMQTNGTGNFNSLGQVSRNYHGMTSAPNGNVYASVLDGDIFMQTNGTGNFIALSQTFRSYYGMTSAPNGNIYAVVNNGDIFMQTNGTGAFVALNQVFRSWSCITAAPNGNVYAGVISGDIFMQTNGTGAFVALNQVSRDYRGMTSAPNGNIYAVVNNGDIFMQTNGTGNFIALSQTFRSYFAITAAPNGNIYVGVFGGDILMQNNDVQGTPNLNGGKLIMKAGTGKGNGQSRFEIVTGQRLVSGTAMQIETLREYVDENGYHIYMSMPVFADNASAIAGGLPTGCQYRTAGGILMIVI